MIGFVIRLIGWALLLGCTARLSDAIWTNDGLTGIAGLQSFHDSGMIALLGAPVILALAGAGPLRAPVTFVGFFLAGAGLTAPFAIARVAGI